MVQEVWSGSNAAVHIILSVKHCTLCQLNTYFSSYLYWYEMKDDVATAGKSL